MGDGAMGAGMQPGGGDPGAMVPGAEGPPQPPPFWVSMLRVMHGVMTAFGRLSVLVDENTHAIHFFISALLQLCDRAGVLYGEVARFVLRLLGFRSRAAARTGKKGAAKGQVGPAAGVKATGTRALPPSAASTAAAAGAIPPGAAWDSLWQN
eukprot:TRINITY_DN30180_c0_g1_i1.p2 TRINITY_DN30180_c0_g1~~TRINITY_DN30180_c0_g1_i1.p2  ORF type:complete len:177 (-),score=2.27 TRINITY_DN30180_c0_g1_i1:249-704(-)